MTDNIGNKERARQTLTTCRDCVYGSCRNGICYSCSEWPERLGITGDDFFCDKAFRRDVARKMIEEGIIK